MNQALKRCSMVVMLASGMLALSACFGTPDKAAAGAAQPVTATAATRAELTFPVGQQLPSPPFTGEAFRYDMVAAGTAMKFPQTNNITFAPGAHSAWHRHGGMVILVTGGAGIYQEEGRPAMLIRRGDVIEIPAGVRHWHGATRDSWFSQMVIYDAAWKPDGRYQDTGNTDNAVTDEYYENLAPVEYANRSDTSYSMFRAGDEDLTLPTFNGPIRLADVVTEDNAAGAPAIHNVVFAPGVINAWHEHEAGQILIVTDGVGYHQIAGQPVEILRPGDVAVCPPGVRHWHGAAPNSRFSHLAANGRRGRVGVTWHEMLTSEEYQALPRP